MRTATALICLLAWPWLVQADEPTKDTRLTNLKTLDSYFPFTPPKDLTSWVKRKLELREQLLVANGLWPMPEKKPLNPVIFDKQERNGVTLEKVYFSSLPGHYVTGNLYRPTLDLGKNPAAKQGKLPGVLFAHGHWANGRLHVANKATAEQSVQTRGEPDRDRGAYFMQAIPTQLARMGFVVFQYDMVGYADSTAVPHANGFADVAGELYLQSAMGLQTWNSIRALDFLESLPEVDATRLGMTGASGGGTQTFLTAALDDRLAVAFPAVMVSTAMQGGCICENTSYLRVETGNVEFAAMFAPKPLAFSCAKDWTQEFLTKGYPELQQLYKLYGREENVAAKAWLEYPHNYNVHARQFMYQWFQKHLIGPDEPVVEQAFEPTPIEALKVFDAQTPRPKDELTVAQLRAAMLKDSQAQLAALTPRDVPSLAEYRRVVGGALRAMIGRDVPGPDAVAVTGYQSTEGPNGLAIHSATIGRRGGLDAIPSRGLIPKGYDGTVVLWLHPKGLASLYDGERFVPAVQQLLDQKVAVFAIDAFSADKPLSVDKRYAGYTYGYNRTLLAQRVADALTAIGNLKHNARAKTIHLVGWEEAGPIALLTKAIARGAIRRTAAELGGFRFEQITNPADPMLLPGALKYGGLDGFLAVAAPDAVLIHADTGSSIDRLSPAAYNITQSQDLRREEQRLPAREVVDWLLK